MDGSLSISCQGFEVAFLTCVLYHHDLKVNLYDRGIDCRTLCNYSLCVPM